MKMSIHIFLRCELEQTKHSGDDFTTCLEEKVNDLECYVLYFGKAASCAGKFQIRNKPLNSGHWNEMNSLLKTKPQCAMKE